MALIELGGAEVNLTEEWGSVGPQATRLTTGHKAGTGCIQCDLTLSNAVGYVSYGTGRSVWQNTPWAGPGTTLWIYFDMFVDVGIQGDYAWGCANVGVSGSGKVQLLGIKDGASGHNIFLADSVLNIVADGPQVQVGQWYPTIFEFQDATGWVRLFWWNSGTSQWEVAVQHKGTPPLTGGQHLAWYGFRSFKGGSLVAKPRIDNCMSITDYDNGDGVLLPPTGPVEIYAGHPAAGTPYYDAWGGSPDPTNKYANWNDGSVEPRASDGDSSYNFSGNASGDWTQTSHYDDDFVPDQDIIGVSFTHNYKVSSGDYGDIVGLIRHGGADAESPWVFSTGASYHLDGFPMTRTPDGLPWTRARLNAMEHGMRRKHHASTPRRDVWASMIHCQAAVGTLAALPPPPAPSANPYQTGGIMAGKRLRRGMGW